jgi:17beta-estradiol 17-dehydrogenase / very-long-chain 3-oxoacyl-CoA reductase
MPLPLIHYLYGSGLPKYLPKNGEPGWALVTGASDGIGRALCGELSARGFDVVLHGRNAGKLDRVRDELQARHPERKFRTVTADAAKFGPADIERIVGAVKDVPLTILVNNVGGTGALSANFMGFEDTTPAEIEAVFSVNVLFPLQLTRALLPRLQTTPNPTLVVTVGSQAHVGQPYIAAYSATKGALHAWTRALAAEQRAAGTQVDVTELVVGATYTQAFEGDSNFRPGLFMPTPDVVARAALARVGRGHRSVYAYFWHRVQTFCLDLLPTSVADGLVANILKPSVKAKAT